MYWFGLLCFVIGLKTRATLISRPIRSKTKTNRDSLRRLFPRFPLFRVSIGLLD